MPPKTRVWNVRRQRRNVQRTSVAGLFFFPTWQLTLNKRHDMSITRFLPPAITRGTRITRAHVAVASTCRQLRREACHLDLSQRRFRAALSLVINQADCSVNSSHSPSAAPPNEDENERERRPRRGECRDIDPAGRGAQSRAVHTIPVHVNCTNLRKANRPRSAHRIRRRFVGRTS